MPTVLRIRGLRFFFYSNEGSEPVPVHVEHAENTAKFWLQPVECANSQGFSARDVVRITRLVVRYERLFEEAWHGHFDA